MMTTIIAPCVFVTLCVFDTHVAMSEQHVQARLSKRARPPSKRRCLKMQRSRMGKAYSCTHLIRALLISAPLLNIRLSHMSHDAEHDDLDGRGVVVNWEDEMKKAPNFGSFGAVYEGKLMLEGGGHVDVVVKVSVAVLETGGQSSSPALLNDTLRYVFSLHRRFTRRDMNQRAV